MKEEGRMEEEEQQQQQQETVTEGTISNRDRALWL